MIYLLLLITASIYAKFLKCRNKEKDDAINK